MHEITNKRNEHGVKDSLDLYRHKNGVLFIQWVSGRNLEDNKREVKRLRTLNIDCFRIKDDIFVREDQVLQAYTDRPI